MKFFLSQESRSRTLLIRFLLLTLVALFLAKVGPTLADEFSGGTPVATQTLAPEQSATPSPTPSESATAQASPEVTPPVSVSESPTATPSPTVPPHALTSQGLIIHIPASLRADPRAKTLRFPHISVTGASTILFCANSPGAVFDISQKGSAESELEGGGLISGDLTDSLILSGPSDQVLAKINGQGGMALSTSGIVSGSSVLFRVIAVNEPTLDERLCNAGVGANIRTTQILALGIGLEVKKGQVELSGK